MGKPKKIISIRSRILKSILALIAVIFIVIICSFKILVNIYIHKSYNNKLESIGEIVTEIKKNNEFVNIYNEQGRELLILSTRKYIRERKSNINIEPEMIILDKNYKLLSNDNSRLFGEYENNKNLAKSLKEHNIDLSSSKDIQLETKNEYYYLKSINLNNSENGENLYLVVAVDISNTLLLFKKINIFLFIIMLLASILAVFISIILSKKIADPIQEISEFAKNIGDGNFDNCEFDLKDKELVELADIMNKAAEDLAKYDKEQKIFFQNVSHELRTPLMSIKGYAEAIKYNVLDKDSASVIILEEGSRLEDLIEELIYMSRMDNITKDYEQVQRDIREILSNCVVKQKIQAINRNIEFKLNFDEEPVLLVCDEKRIYRGFSNIIDNSLRYAESEIIITCKNAEGCIEVIIENDGEKLAHDEENKIFDRFYKGKGGKHGIGLSIVKSIIEKHNGTVHAENSLIGVKFIIKFNIKN